MRRPATLRQEEQDVHLLVTTEKMGDLILLRIDEVTGMPGDADGGT